MRVLHLIKSLGRGGAEVLLAEGLGVADRERFEYSYAYFLPWKDAMAGAIEARGGEVTCFGARSNRAILASVPRLARLLREQKVDLVHAHLPVAGVAARLAGRLAGVPVVYTEHNLQERYHPVTKWANARTWPLQAEALAVSDDVARSIASHIGSAVPVRTLLNGVNVDTFDPAGYDGQAVRARLGIPADAPVVGSVAVFRVQKRLGDWVDVARRVRDAVPGAHFLLVGDGPERGAVEAAIGAAGLADGVHLAGLQEETRPYFAAMDAYLMTSQFEGLPIALLEAMAMEVPPVVTAVGGIPELIRPPEEGAVLPYGEVEPLASAVVGLLTDPDRRRAVGQAARARVADAFSMRRMQGELEAIYNRVVSDARRKP